MDNIKNVKSGEAVTNLLEFTSISGVYAMDLVVVDVPPPGAPVTEDQQKYMEYKGVHVLRGASFLFARFLPFNIMHHIHDDLMNLFMTMVEYTDPFYEVVSTVAERNGKDGSGTGPAALFNLQSRLVIVDAHGAGGYAVMTQYLSDLPVTHITEIVSSSQALAKQIARSKDEPLPPASDGNLVRFESAVVGITRHCNWYQYGFRIPQGPIEGKEVDGFNVRLFTNHILARIPPLRRLPASVPLRLEGGGSEAAPTAPPPKPEEGELVLDPIQRYIVIFSRTLNRNILNEPELANALRDQFPFLKVVIIRLEETPIPTIIRVLERPRVAVGMHGSILILAMFMPKCVCTSLFHAD
ncbi:MAG: hypothetical protein BJ554DRAFT_8058 [Olpidium bornovanus]|uniref:Glycosyltransferase 61 catalytic domain-containing protein n=1 Tax=Olpidium bornovanus TaxID=278681 RepID=A0A8H7ZV58_9FUNG|nr:MAG: hypothetical protein BJ554DRAFT_8058 [Olpidium bornovanus]